MAAGQCGGVHLDSGGVPRRRDAGLLRPIPAGAEGKDAGGPARSVCEIAGIQNIRTKSLGSNNKQNVVLATIEALKQLRSPEDVAKLRGKSVEEILG